MRVRNTSRGLRCTANPGCSSIFGLEGILKPGLHGDGPRQSHTKHLRTSEEPEREKRLGRKFRRISEEMVLVVLPVESQPRALYGGRVSSMDGSQSEKPKHRMTLSRSIRRLEAHVQAHVPCAPGSDSAPIGVQQKLMQHSNLATTMNV